MESVDANRVTTLSAGSPDQWQAAPLLFEHKLHMDARFRFASLAELIETYPRPQYSIVHMGVQGDGRRTWREGELGELGGLQVLEAIQRGRLWLNLRNGHEVHQHLQQVQQQIFAEAQALALPLATYDHRLGILVSSPGAQVYYHADLPGQGLLQLQGRKRIYIYPPQRPYLSDEGLENIALSELEVGLRYEPDFDRGAKVFDLEPGQGLFWPLNSPHRIENHDCLNVSMTLEYWTEDIRRRQMINVANGILRQHLGYAPRGRKLSGPSFYAKAGLQALWRRSGLLQARRRAARPVDFRLDPDQLGQIIDIGAGSPHGV